MRKRKEYDIFISYRRRDTGDKAEHLKDLLEPYYRNRVSFDRENLTGLFDVALAERIDKCTDFLLILGKNSLVFEEKDFAPELVNFYQQLGQSSIEEFQQAISRLGSNTPIDFVRIEIARALNRKGIHIIPIVPEKTETFAFESLRLPPDISGITRYEAIFYSDNPNALFKSMVTTLRPKLKSKPDKPFIRRMIAILAVLLALLTGIGILHYAGIRQQKLKEQLKTETALDGQHYLNWSKDITLEQLEAIHKILDNMVPVSGGTFLMGAAPTENGTYDTDIDIEIETPQLEQTVKSFWMSKYEVSVSEWAQIMNEPYKASEAYLPKTSVSFEECRRFAEKLYNLTALPFCLPTEAEWEYAARGGNKPDGTKYAGNNDPDKVAWYSRNAGGSPHVCDAANSPMYCNSLNLYDMSGNVSEWCDTDFRRYSDLANSTSEPLVIDPESKVIRGGNYDSETYELTVYHREPMNVHEKVETVGLRLIIRD